MATAECSVCKKECEEDEVTRVRDQAVCTECTSVFLERFSEDNTVSSRMAYGGFWIRVGASLIDGVVLSAVGHIVGLLGVLIGDAGGAVFARIFMTVFGLGYATYFVGEFGATPGKMACGLKIVRPNGDAISYARAFGRIWAECLSSLILCVGYIMVAFDAEKRALHDRICDTRVVKA
jgi:uncharacterized RDD family membrane protein YckC